MEHTVTTPLLREQEKVANQSHIIDDLQRELWAIKANVREARDLLADAAVALRNGDLHVVEEFIDRSYVVLGRTCPARQE